MSWADTLHCAHGKAGPRKVDEQGRTQHDSNTPESVPPPRASPVCFPEHVSLPLGMDVLDDGGHGLSRFLGEDREITVRPGTHRHIAGGKL